MTANDVTTILASLQEVLQRLAVIEERTGSIADHEVRIRSLEAAQQASGSFTLSLLGKLLVGAGGVLIVVASVASTIHGW